MTRASDTEPPLRELVICSLESWDEVWRRNQLLVAELLELEPNLRVLFVEPPVDALHELLERHRLRFGHGRSRPRPGAALERVVTLQATKWLPRVLGPFADRSLASGVEHAAREIGLSSPLLWVNDPAYAAVVERTGWPTLYDVTDDWLLASCTERERERRYRNEAFLLARAREVVVCSPRLVQSKGRHRHVRLVPNAVDADWIRTPARRPPDLPDGPVACYVGTLHPERLDVDLCVGLARHLDGRGTLLLVGPDELDPRARQRLAGEPGIMLTGPRAHDEVPGYLQYADVLVVPHLCAPFTESLDPIKAYEYRAVGRPVVATPVAGFRGLGHPVILSEGRAFFDAVLTRLPGTPPPPDLLPLPPGLPTWRSRAEAMRDALRSVAGAPESEAPR